MSRVDAHHHLWDVARRDYRWMDGAWAGPLRRAFTPQDLRRLAELRQAPGGDTLVGLRHQVEDEPDPRWLVRPDVCRGLHAIGQAGLVYDLLIRPAQIPAAIGVVGE